MAFNLAGLPAELRNLVIGHVAQLPAADLARASHVNKQWNANPLLLKAMLKTVPVERRRCAARLAAITSPVLDVLPMSATAFDLAGLPQELRNHILGYMAQVPVADVARALRVNREWNAHPLLLKALLKPVQGLAKRASYDVMCPECGVNTAEGFLENLRDDFGEAICANTWEERRDDGTIVARSALACRNCLQAQYENAIAAIDPDQDLPAANEEDGSSICFILPVPGKDPVPVRELSVVREHGLVERPEHAQHYPLQEMNTGYRDEGCPDPDWLLY